MKVLLLDLTHGGDILAREYLRRGNDVTAVDVYRTSSALAERLASEGVRCLPAAPAERFDLAVAPIHCPDRFMGLALADRTITHHQAVGEMASFAFPVVEVTGVHGKTSTVQALSFLMASKGKRVLSLSSSGLSTWHASEQVLEDKVSIAPPTMLRLSSSAYRDHDLGVFEVSLGGTGLGKVSVITGLQDDYPIAAGTRRAFDGKAQMAALAREKLVISKEEEDIWRPLAKRCSDILTFGRGGDVRVELTSGPLGTPSRVRVATDNGSVELELSPSYMASAYRLAFMCSLAAAQGLGQDPLALAPFLKGFRGARGRGEVTVDTKGEMVRERNPGVSAASLDFLIGALVNDHGCRDIGLVLDPVNRKVCEKLDIDRIRDVCDRFPQVTGRFVLPSGSDLGTSHGFELIEGIDEARSRHRTVLWATKEGYL